MYVRIATLVGFMEERVVALSAVWIARCQLLTVVSTAQKQEHTLLR